MSEKTSQAEKKTAAKSTAKTASTSTAKTTGSVKSASAAKAAPKAAAKLPPKKQQRQPLLLFMMKIPFSIWMVLNIFVFALVCTSVLLAMVLTKTTVFISF